MFKMNIKKIIYTSILLFLFSLIFISTLLFQATNSNDKTQKYLDKLSYIQKQNKEILRSMVKLNANQNNLLLANSDKSFNTLEKELLSQIDIKYIDFKSEIAFENKYNTLLSLVKDDLKNLIIIQNNFFSNQYSFFTDKEELQIRSQSIYDEIEYLMSQNLGLRSIELLNTFKEKINALVLSTSVVELKKLKKHLDFLEVMVVNDIGDKDLDFILSNKKRILAKKLSLNKNKIFLEKSLKYQEYLSNRVFENMSQINILVNNLNTKFLDRNEKNNSTLETYSILISILALFVLFVFASLLISRVNRPLNKITVKMNEIFNDENKLSENIEHEHDDEFKHLSDTFNKMTSKLASNIHELKEKDEKISAMNKNLEKLVDKRTKQLSVKSQKVSDLLNNSSQGFLSFSVNLQIDEEYSKECNKFLGSDLEGKNICDLIFAKEDKKEFYKQTFADVFKEEQELLVDAYLRLLPQEIILNRRALKLEYKLLENKRIMLVLTNISSKKKLEKKIKEEQERVKMIVSIISRSELFYETIDSFEVLLKDIEDYINNKEESHKDLAYYYRQIHTFKGLFSQVYMKNLVSYLHDVESEISNLIKENDLSILKELLNTSALREYLELDLDLIKSILGKEFLEDKKLMKVEKENFNYLEKLVETLYTSDECNTLYKDLALQIKKFKQKTFFDVFSSYEKLCFDESAKLSKYIHPLDIQGDKELFIPRNFKKFSTSLIHVFRNVIDHGIESSDTRSFLGKDLFGTIKCEFYEEEKNYVIKISDDGAGINLEKIKEKALSLGLYTEEEINSIEKEELMALIFENSFSTKDEVSSLSGRGVGMAAVKEETLKLNGNIKIQSEENVGTSFIFELAKKEK